MPRKQKRPNVYQTLNIRHWEAKQHAMLIRDKFPNILSIEIERTTVPEMHWMGEPETTVERFSPDQRAFFQYPCRFRDCVGGYLNLANEVSDLVLSGGPELRGKAHCDGWQDEQRINKHQCLLKTEYRIAVKYTGKLSVQQS